jgi:hypothetical protein
LRSTISSTEARLETIPSRTWSLSVPHVTLRCIASLHNDDYQEFLNQAGGAIPVNLFAKLHRWLNMRNMAQLSGGVVWPKQERYTVLARGW